MKIILVITLKDATVDLSEIENAVPSEAMKEPELLDGKFYALTFRNKKVPW